MFYSFKLLFLKCSKRICYYYHCTKNEVFYKCDQIRSFLRIRSHLLKKCLMENFICRALYLKIVEFIESSITYLNSKTISIKSCLFLWKFYVLELKALLLSSLLISFGDSPLGCTFLLFEYSKFS